MLTRHQVQLDGVLRLFVVCLQAYPALQGGAERGQAQAVRGLRHVLPEAAGQLPVLSRPPGREHAGPPSRQTAARG